MGILTSQVYEEKQVKVGDELIKSMLKKVGWSNFFKRWQSFPDTGWILALIMLRQEFFLN
jgi:hypothetical protein